MPITLATGASFTAVPAMHVSAAGNVALGSTTPPTAHALTVTGSAIVGGNIGIGTTAPVAGLHVVGTDAAPIYRADQYYVNMKVPPNGIAEVPFTADYNDPAPTSAGADAGLIPTYAEVPPLPFTAGGTPLTTSQTFNTAGYARGSYTVTASSYYTTGGVNYDAYRAFNKTVIDTNDGWMSQAGLYSTSSPYQATSGGPTNISGTNYTGSFIQIQMPQPAALYGYELTTRINNDSSAPKSWIVAGSTNGSVWSFVESRTQNIVDNSSFTLRYIVGSNIEYSYYRFVFTSTTGSPIGSVSVGELKLFVSSNMPLTNREFPPGQMTSNTTMLLNTYGAGPYRATSSGDGAANPAFFAFNKTNTASWSTSGTTYNATSGAYTGTVSTSNLSGEWLQLSLPIGIIPTGYTLNPGPTATTSMARTWWLLASKDAITWTTVASQRTNYTSWTLSTDATFAITGVTTPYQYFRLVIDSINTGGAATRVAIGQLRITGTQVYPKYKGTLVPFAPGSGALTNYGKGTYAVYADSMANATTYAEASPYFAFNENSSNISWSPSSNMYTSNMAYASTAPSLYVQLPRRMTLASYQIVTTVAQQATRPTSWKLYGASNTTDWTIIEDVVNGLGANVRPVTPLAAYDNYRLQVYANASLTAAAITVRQLRLYGAFDDLGLVQTSASGFVGISTAPSAPAAITIDGSLEVTGAVAASEGMITTIEKGPHTTDSGLFYRWLSRTCDTLSGSWMTASQPYVASPASVATQNLYSGAINLPDGRVGLVPYLGATFGLYNPQTNSYSTVAAAAGFYGGVLAPNNTVVCVPYTHSNVGVFNMNTNTFSLVGNTPGNYAFRGGCLLQDGRVLFAPANSRSIGIFDPIVQTMSYVALPSLSTMPTQPYGAAVPLPNGNVVLMNLYDGVPIIFDPKMNTFPYYVEPSMNYSFNLNAGFSFTNILTLPNGQLMYIPSAGAFVTLFDPITKVLTYTPFSPSMGGDTYGNGVLLPDGRVLMIPINTAGTNKIRFGLYDYRTNISSYLFLDFASAAGFIGGALMQDGRLLLVPTSTNLKLAIMSGFARPPRELCLHPAFNKF